MSDVNRLWPFFMPPANLLPENPVDGRDTSECQSRKTDNNTLGTELPQQLLSQIQFFLCFDCSEYFRSSVFANTIVSYSRLSSVSCFCCEQGDNMDSKIGTLVQSDYAAKVFQARNRESLPIWMSQRNRSLNRDNIRSVDDQFHRRLYRELLFAPLSTGTCWALVSHIVGSLKLKVPLGDALKHSKPACVGLLKDILPQSPVKSLKILVGDMQQKVSDHESILILAIVAVWGKDGSCIEVCACTKISHSAHESRHDGNARSQQFQVDPHDNDDTTARAENIQTAESMYSSSRRKRKCLQQKSTQLNTSAFPGLSEIGSRRDCERPENPSCQAKRPRKSVVSALDARFSGQNSNFVQDPDKIGLEIGKVNDTSKYYEYAFTSLNRNICAHLAKAIIKRIEPNKQVRHPYNGGKSGNPDKSRPNWWPKVVRHREPDHLRKKDIVPLMTHLVRKVGYAELAEAASEPRRLIKSELQIQLLDKILKRRQAEEQYGRGGVDGSNSTISPEQNVGAKVEEPRKTSSPPQAQQAPIPL